MIPINFLEQLILASGNSLLKTTIIQYRPEINIPARRPPPPPPHEVAVLIAFGALDELIDKKIPEHIGDSFKKRAAALGKTINIPETLIGTYRLIIPIRNKFVHKSKKGNIDFDEKFLSKILNQIRLELIFQNERCTHAENFLAYAFEDLKKSVKIFDSDGEDLPNVKEKIKYYPMFRARHSIQLTNIDNEIIKRSEKYNISDDKGQLHPIPDEYLIKADSKQYLVPGEFFGDATEIDSKSIKHWIVSNEFLAFSK